MKTKYHRVTGRFMAMGTECVIIIYTNCTNDGEFAVGEAIKEVRRIEKKYSRFDEQSIISRINRESWKNPIDVDQETALLLDFGAVCFDTSGGAFDVTCASLYQTWRNGRKVIPSADEIREALRHVGWKKVKWDGEHISLATEQMRIDLGGIGKEYAADRAVAVLKANGIDFGMVNFGGDIAVLGGKPDGSGWKIGVAPGSGFENKSARSTVEVADHVIEAWKGGVATSGTTERFIEIDGIRFSHLINAIRGWPLVGELSFTVTHSSCLAAGALASQRLLAMNESSRYSL